MLTRGKHYILKIYTVTDGKKIAASFTSLSELGRQIESSGNALRVRFSRSGGDIIRFQGLTIVRAELKKIKGRGRIRK